MKNQTNKVLVIGLDGATFDVLDPLLESGHLPNLSNLKQNGSWGALKSTIPPFTAAAWSTLITGQNPGQHGILSFSQRDRFNYDLTGHGFVNAQHFEHTLWEILSDAGKRICVVNVPLTYPARSVNGYMITGMLTPTDSQLFTFPPELAVRLGKEYLVDVDFIRDGEQFRLYGLPSKAEMLPMIHHVTKVRINACIDLMAEEMWDFFMVVFTGTDRVSHFFWDDLVTITNDSPSNIQLKLLDYFHDLDQAIGKLVERSGPDTTTIIISDHGFGPAPNRRFYLNVWLEKMGLLKQRAAEGFFDLEYWRTQIGRNKSLKSLLRRIVPQTTQDSVKVITESRSKDIIAWEQTQAYFVPIYFHVCGIEINVAGERRHGFVKKGDTYERLRDQIIQSAKKLRDPETGTLIIDVAARREELFNGRYVSQFPDVILVLKPEYVGAGSLAGSSLFEPHPSPIRPGEHREDGIFIANGSLIEKQDELSNLCLLDVPATILYVLDIPVPSQFDGRVLTELVDKDHLNAHPIVFQENLIKTSPAQTLHLIPEQNAEIEKRLRGLGYIE